MGKVVNVQIAAEDVKAFMAEFMAFAFEMELQVQDHAPLEHLNGCPVSKEMLGTTFMALIENMLHMRAIDHQILHGIVDNIKEILKPLPTGPLRPTVLM